MSDVPMVTTWYGRRLEDMSKDELIKAVTELVEWNKALVDGAHADRTMLVKAFRSLRPQ